MPGTNETPSLSPTPAVAHYETLYASAIDSLAALLSDDKLDNWFADAGMNADEHQTQLEQQPSLLEEKVQDLVAASKKLHSTGKAWMDAAAQHPTQTKEAEKQKYDKLREDHQVAALAGRALERLKDLRDAMNVAIETRNAEQHGQSNIVPDVSFQDFFNPSDEVRSLTDAASAHYGQSTIVADVNLQDPLTESDEVRGSTDAASGHPGQSIVYADVNLQDSFTENGEVRGSADAALVCYASEYMSNVQTLSATLRELERYHRDAISNEIIQAVKEASNRVSTVARKWMRKAATDPVRYRTESQELQAMRKDLHVLSLQRQASNRLQELRSARSVRDQASTEQDRASTDQYKACNDMTKHATTQHPEGFQAHPEIANLAGSETSVSKEQVSSLRPEGFQALPEIANLAGSETSASQDHLLSSLSNATVVENIKEPPSDQGSETSVQASHADEYEELNEPFSDSDAEQASNDADDSEAEQASYDADEFELKYEDHNEPSSESEAPDQGIDEANELDEFENFNEPISDSEDPEQISEHADQCDESSSDAEDPEQSGSDADGHDEPFSDVDDPASSDADD